MTDQTNSNPEINKSEIVARIAAKKLGINSSVVKQSVDVMVEQMAQQLNQGRRIELRGFGSFALRHYEPRKARNPKSGESVAIKSRSKTYFKPGKELRLSVNAAVV